MGCSSGSSTCQLLKRSSCGVASPYTCVLGWPGSYFVWLMSVWTWPFLSISMFTNLDVSFGSAGDQTFFNQVSVRTLVLRLGPLTIAHFLSGMRRESVCVLLVLRLVALIDLRRFYLACVWIDLSVLR